LITNRKACLSVTARVAESDPAGTVTLKVDESALCAACSGICLWRRAAQRSWGPFDVGWPIESGATVEVSLPATTVLRGCVILYGLPWSMMLAGAGAAGVGIGTDGAAALGALAGAAVGFAAIRFLRRGIERWTTRELEIRWLR
jgi:positive regulator of sigma E activity